MLGDVSAEARSTGLVEAAIREAANDKIYRIFVYDVLMFSLRAGDGFSSSYHNTIGCDAREDCLFVADGLILLASSSHVGLDDIPTTFISENWKRVPPDDGWGTQARKGESAGCIKVQSWEPPDILVMNLNDRTIQVVDGLQEQKGRWSEPGPIRIDEVRIADSVGDNPGDEYARSKERVDAYSPKCFGEPVYSYLRAGGWLVLWRRFVVS